ncbi:MAG: hypothetical protein ACO3Q1_05835 [Candidatus Nanopelagicales bacterium]
MYYLDSSAVVKLVFEEKESKTLREFLKQNGFKAENKKQILNDYGVNKK